MSVTEFAVRHHVAVVVLCLGAILVGGYCYHSFPRESFPDIDVPLVIVTAVLEGANPTDVEQSVTIPLETELDGVEGLKEMRSVSMDSLSMVSLEFDTDIDIQVALSRVRDAVDQAKPDLSKDAEEPTVKEFSFTSFPILVYHMVGSETVALSELDDLAEELTDQIQLIPGVLDVDVFGTREREVVIEVDPERLHFYSLPLAQVRGVLEGSNRNVSAGAAELPTNRIVMRVPGEFTNPAEIFSLVVGRTAAGIPIYMRDLASVRYDFKDETSRSRLYDLKADDGAHSVDAYRPPERSISLQVKKRSGANILSVCRGVDAVMARHPFPATVRVVKGLDGSKDVNMMVGDLENGVATALVLVLLVIFVGMGLRNAVLVSLAVPFSMLLSFVVLRMMGETLNMMVLFSLVLAVGMLVDNAIVIMESVYRHMCLGKPRVQAAIEGTQEVLWPVTTSTLTTVVAFIPLLFWPGIIGEFMGYLPMTVIIVITASLFVAVVITPTLGTLFLKVKPSDRTSIDPDTLRPRYGLALRYRALLEFMLDRPRWTLATIAAVFVFTFALYGVFGRGTEFFPPVDPDQLLASIKPPEGISLDESDRLCRQMEDRILGAPGSGYDQPVRNIKHASVTVGLEGVGGANGGLRDDGGGPVRVQIELVDRDFRSEPSTDTLQEMRNRIEGLDKQGRRVTTPLYGAEFDVIRPQEGPPTGKPVSIEIFGEDLNQMTAVVNDMKRLIRETRGTAKPTDDAVTAQPTLEWRVDRARAGVFGLEQATVSAAIEIAVGGTITGTFDHGDDERDIRVRVPPAFRRDTDRLRNITIPVANGGSVPIVSVASATLVPGPVTIKHFQKQRVLTAAAEVQPGIRNDADIRAAFQEKARAYRFPPGITYRFAGAAEEQQESQDFLGQAFVVALLLVLFVEVVQFNSIAISGIIMTSVVLSLMGVLVGLLAVGQPFGIIMTGIGVISLAGVVVNNAIVLLGAIQLFEARGNTVRDAVVSAAMTRLRPVLLTAVTTILGLVPMCLKLNWDFRTWTWSYDTASSQWWQSMSSAVVFGMLVATVLTLGVVPTLYGEYARIRDWARRRFGASPDRAA